MTTSLVTGGTSGIGLAFARQLAAEGSDLVLVATNAERLASVADELTAGHQIGIEQMAADLSTDDGIASVTDRLLDRTKPIDLLINNAGIGMKGSFVETSIDEHTKMLHLNGQAVLKLTHAALGPMLERGSGGVLNVSSVAAYMPGLRPASTYAATKAFVLTLTEGLAPTLAGTNVRISAVCPGYVKSEFHERAGIKVSTSRKFLWLEPDAVAAAALADFRAGKIVSVPGAFYKALVLALRLAPRSAVRRGSRLFGSR